MVFKKLLFGVFVMCGMAMAQGVSTQVVGISSVRGEYELNFSNVYEIPINPDIETMISLPPGYKITLAMPGSPDYVSANVLQNTLYLTRPVDHIIETNVIVHVVTPEGLEQKLVIRCIGSKKSAKVLAVQFTKANSSEVNRTIEAMKARYIEQLNAKMSTQEDGIKKTVFNETMSNGRSWFVHTDRKETGKEYDGAEVWVDGMINSGDNTYIYIIANVKQNACNVVALENVMVGKTTYEAQLVGVKELSEKEYYYCYSIPQLTIGKKAIKVNLLTRIWSKTHKITVKIS
jgi:hypothetical protein